MFDLPRIKPAPIPVIRPVPEHSAKGPLAETYQRTKAGLGVPWMGVVAMAFAQYPRFYQCLWDALDPVVATDAFSKACDALRAAADREADLLAPRALVPDLERLGYTAAELEEIRACNEVFSAGNMPYVLMATLARGLLEGQAWTADGQAGGSKKKPAPSERPVLIEPHHADASIAALYEDIQATLGLPFVNTDYRAFARWPSYFEQAWPDLKRVVLSTGYAPAISRVHDTAVSLAAGLPNLTGVTPQRLIDAAHSDAAPGDVVSIVRLFQWLLPGLIVNVAILRQQLHPTGT